MIEQIIESVGWPVLLLAAVVLGLLVWQLITGELEQ